ncbi:MAG: phosphoribosylglycinamide formyltransferase [Saprospirales bacterium]|jgi:phosphoribosylglycinamide formyltransferase-1|nr:phosphoribosylglycinamide formyltransferase [Saprospirales bacterium]MBK8921154.1 phosphoribosylglycinamide formyltransferase [Saprospirales bacterium]
MHHIAIFASGTGSNARKIIEYFRGSRAARIALVVSNKQDAGVLDIARANGIPALVIHRNAFYSTEDLLRGLASHAVDFIVLAGFLWLIPPYLVRAFPRRIVNIHPALLPKFGGKGMYGMHVHEAVKAAGEAQTGITIHYVNEHYDAGDIIFQAACPVGPEDTPGSIAARVQQLEHRHFPEIIARLL